MTPDMTASQLQEIPGYAAVRENGAGLIDISSRGRFLVSGTEAIQFLNGLITNDMKTLAENNWMPAVFPNVQGRLIASVRIARFSASEDGVPNFLIDTEVATHAQTLKTIERFTLAGDFRVTDITGRTAHLTLQGRQSAEIGSSIVGEELEVLQARGVKRTRFENADITILRSTHTGADGFDFIIEADASGNLRNRLIEAGAREVDDETAELLRIEAGIPRYSVDMDDTNVVSETALDDAVSYTKGCYVGQEIIARIKYRGHVAKKLTGLSFVEKVTVERGSMIKSIDGKEIGRVTSVAYSAQLGHTVGLGYLKYDYLTAGTVVKVDAGESVTEATVTTLPFIGETISSSLV
jgi:folate-binding protein YgfZ